MKEDKIIQCSGSDTTSSTTATISIAVNTYGTEEYTDLVMIGDNYEQELVANRSTVDSSYVTIKIKDDSKIEIETLDKAMLQTMHKIKRHSKALLPARR